MTKGLSWRELYEAAMLELDHARLQTRIEIALAAIQKAIVELEDEDKHKQDKQKTVKTRQDLMDALHSLRSLQRLELDPVRDNGLHPPSSGVVL